MSDMLKYIQIQNQDGSYGDQIPLSVDSVNVFMANDDNLEVAMSKKADKTEVQSLQAAVGSPLTAITASAMIDTNKIYVYTGSETGYTNGDWYYWNGTAWIDGGVYNAVAFETDTTLTQSGQAADAKVVGDKFEEVNTKLDSVVYKKYEIEDKLYHAIDYTAGFYVDIRTKTGVPYPETKIVYAYDANKTFLGNINITEGTEYRQITFNAMTRYIRFNSAPSVPYVFTILDPETLQHNIEDITKIVETQQSAIQEIGDDVASNTESIESIQSILNNALTSDAGGIAWLYRKVLPDYYYAQEEYPSSFADNEYLQKRIDAIPDGKHFIFITDRHWPNNAKQSTQLVAYIKSKLGISYVIDGGDTINRNDTTENAEGKYLACKLLQSVVNANYDAWGQGYLPVLGNHDINTANPPSTEETDMIKQRIPYNAVADILFNGLTEKAVHYTPTEKLRTFLGEDQTDFNELMDYFSLNYYVDDVESKIRFIIYNTGCPYNGVVYKHFGRHSMSETSLVLDWLYDVLMSTPNDYSVVVIGHEPTYVSGTILSNTSKLIPQMVNMFKARVKSNIYLNESSAGIGWIANGNHSYDFTNAPVVGKVFMMGGHWHRDYTVICSGTTYNNCVGELKTETNFTIDQTNAQLPIIYTQCDAYSVSSSSGIYHDMILNTVTEQAFDIVTITDDGVVCTRIGAGVDREYLFT